MSSAEIIIAVATLVTAIGGVAVVVIPLVHRVSALKETTTNLVTKTDEVHTIINSNHQSMLRREQVLIAALQKAGVEIPSEE